MRIDRQKILEKYQGHCAYCGKDITLKTMQIDHYPFYGDDNFIVFHGRYTVEDMRAILKSEYGMDGDNTEPSTGYVRHTINGGEDFNNQPCYIACDGGRGSFRCFFWDVEKLKLISECLV